jgi:hypothetical protein
MRYWRRRTVSSEGKRREIGITIRLHDVVPEREKEIVNSIRGVVKALAKRFGFRMEFEKG